MAEPPAASSSAPASTEEVKISVQKERRSGSGSSSLLRLLCPCCTSKQYKDAAEAFDRHTSITSQTSKGSAAAKKKRGRMSVEDFGGFLNKHAELWAMLGINLGLSDERCKDIAARVAMENYGRMGSADNLDAPEGETRERAVTMSKDDFVEFHRAIVKDPKGQQRFFHQCGASRRPPGRPMHPSYLLCFCLFAHPEVGGS